MDVLDGWEDIKDEEQKEKIRKGVEQGFVDDGDWKGEEGGNRPVVKGEKKKGKKKAAEGEGDEEEE